MNIEMLNNCHRDGHFISCLTDLGELESWSECERQCTGWNIGKPFDLNDYFNYAARDPRTSSPVDQEVRRSLYAAILQKSMLFEPRNETADSDMATYSGLQPQNQDNTISDIPNEHSGKKQKKKGVLCANFRFDFEKLIWTDIKQITKQKGFMQKWTARFGSFWYYSEYEHPFEPYQPGNGSRGLTPSILQPARAVLKLRT